MQLGLGLGVTARLLGGDVVVAAGPFAFGGFEPAFLLDFVNDPAGALARMTHERSGNAMMRDAQGRWVWAPHNLLTWSEDLSSAGWIPVNGTKSGNTFTATSDGGKVQQNVIVPSGSTLVAYVAKGTASIIRVDNGSAAANDPIDFDLDALTYTIRANNESASIIDVGGGVFKITIVRGATAGSRVSISPINSGESFVWVPGCHLYRSDFPMADNPATGNSYVPTADTPVYLPRIGHHEQKDYSTEFLPPESALGHELIDNGAFADASNWNLGAAWSISESSAHWDVSGGNGYVSQFLNGELEVGVKYLITFDVTIPDSGSVSPYFASGGADLSVTETGTYVCDGHTPLI